MIVSKPSDRLIVALDFPEVAQARALVATLGDRVSFYKIGLELAYGGTAADNGFALADELAAQGKKIFLDLKLHDIPNTVQRATAQIARRGVDFLTVHAFPQTMAAAKAGAAGSHLKLLAVTVLTSYDDDDLEAAGYRFPVRDLVPHRAQQAKALGIDGLVAAASEAAELRRAVGPKMILVTPGIRPAGGAAGDQKRVATPAAAIAAGADYLVVGRPITEAADPRAAAEAIQHEIATARG
ncbi:MAG: orotidine-5'-phosphate decarboxylase [Methylovirgula sp.]|nr:orotidine-5'-phosphate decarboxylase [Methylovirgula sp.]